MIRPRSPSTRVKRAKLLSLPAAVKRVPGRAHNLCRRVSGSLLSTPLFESVALRAGRSLSALVSRRRLLRWVSCLLKLALAQRRSVDKRAIAELCQNAKLIAKLSAFTLVKSIKGKLI